MTEAWIIHGVNRRCFPYMSITAIEMFAALSHWLRSTFSDGVTAPDNVKHIQINHPLPAHVLSAITNPNTLENVAAAFLFITHHLHIHWT
jgi:hypothetical protein